MVRDNLPIRLEQRTHPASRSRWDVKHGLYLCGWVRQYCELRGGMVVNLIYVLCQTWLRTGVGFVVLRGRRCNAQVNCARRGGVPNRPAERDGVSKRGREEIPSRRETGGHNY